MFVRIVVLLAMLGITSCGPSVKESATVANYSNLLNSSNYLSKPPGIPEPTVEPTSVVVSFPEGKVYKVTYYTRSIREGTSRGVTRSGQMVRPGIIAVAVDENGEPVIALGTQVYIESLGEAVVLDTGGGLCETCLDYYMEDYQKAKEAGVDYLKMTVNQPTNTLQNNR